VETFRIVGVLAPDFYFGRDGRTPVDVLVAHAAPIRTYMVRLRAGVPQGAAEQRITEAARRAATSPIPADWTGVQLESVRERWVGSLRPILFGVTAAAGLVLIIVCANVAVLMLLRSMRRQREVAVRMALGSAWHHIVRMLLAETLLICGAALALGIALTGLMLGTLAPLVETQLGRQAPTAAGIALDGNVLAIVGAVSLTVAVALSLAPLTSWGRGLTNALRQDARVASEGRAIRRVRGALIAFEVAGSLVLLVGCGLMVRSVLSMLDTELGFEPKGLSASRVMLRARNYPDGAYGRFHERFAAELSAAAGAPVVFSTWPPFVPPPAHLIEADGGSAGAMGGFIGVSPGYFATFRIPLRQGREFTRAEASTDAAVAVISESLARRLWPGSSAIGRRVRDVEQTPGGSRPGPWRTVIGIAADVRQEYDDADRGDYYAPRLPDGRFGTFYVRSDRAAGPLFDDLRRIAAAIDRDAVINPPRLLAGDDRALDRMQFMSYLLTGFAVAAAGLAMLGIYGVTAYGVQQRRKEVAIRVALGATERSVIGIFVGEGAWLLGFGTAAGLLGGVMVSWILRNRVFGVQPFDPPTYVAACVLLVGTGLLAAAWAARAAVLRHPAAALNSE
jgi:predicted permease